MFAITFSSLFFSECYEFCFSYFNLVFADTLFADIGLESGFEFGIGNSDRGHRQSCCSCGHLVDLFSCNAFNEVYLQSSSNLKCQLCYPSNVYDHESFN